MAVAAPFEHRTREDAEAARLYAEYSDRIHAYCLRRLGSRTEAEDAVQATFLHTLRALRRGVVPESESAWLYAIAKNVCRCHLRTRSRRPLAGERGLELLASRERDEDGRELLGALRVALESLPERQRHAFVLREWRGLSAEEIATHLGTSPPAAHALLTRARRSLALALKAAQRGALGVASLAYELRAWLKGALGGVSAKVAVATIAVLGMGAGGTAVTLDQRSVGERPVPVTTSARSGDVLDLAPGARLARRGVGRSDGRRGLVEGSSGRGRARSVSGPWIPPERRPGDDLATRPVDAPEPTVPPSDPEPAASAEAVVIPKVETPSVDLPSVDLPPVDLPPVDVPAVDLPPVNAPEDALPTVDPPPVDVPTVDVPSVDLAAVDLPPLSG